MWRHPLRGPPRNASTTSNDASFGQRKRLGETRPRRRPWYTILVCALVGWTAIGILLTANSAGELSKESAPAGQKLRLRWTHWMQQSPHRQRKFTVMTKNSVSANRRFLSMLLSDDHFFDKGVKDAKWKEAFLDGVSAVGAESMTLLMNNLQASNVRLAPSCLSDISLEPLPSEMKRLFIASNQHQSQDILPNFIRQVLLFILDNPQIQFFVSIYESGSVDRTPYLLSLLKTVLTEIGVDNAIEYNGALSRKKGQQRIDFLAQVRNAALQPMMDHSKRGVMYNRMIFINDVYFCKEDVHRLLLHDGDLNCGMDFVHHTLVGRKTKYDPNEIVTLKRQYYGGRLKDDEAVQKVLKIPPALRGWDSKTHTEPYRYIAKDPETWMDFYDIWVSHDAAGRHFQNDPPYVRNNSYEQTRLKQGLPFPAECCWNGVAVLNPEPFTKYGLLFRASAEDECPTSECVLLCHDFQRLGYRRVTVDPGVWTTYTYEDARLLALVGVRDLHKVPWKTVKAAPPMKDIHIKPGQLVDCCPLRPGKEIVIFEECSTNYSIWNVSSALKLFDLTEESPEPIPISLN